MSFVPTFAPEAKSQCLELEPVLQDLILDEVERVAENPFQYKRDDFYDDFNVRLAGTNDYLFVQFHLDRPAHRLTVAGIALFSEPAAP